MIDEVSLFASRFNQLGCAYMVTGATAAIVYGQPRLTNDIDVVIAVEPDGIARFAELFAESDFYLPPPSVKATGVEASQRFVPPRATLAQRPFFPHSWSASDGLITFPDTP